MEPSATVHHPKQSVIQMIIHHSDTHTDIQVLLTTLMKFHFLPLFLARRKACCLPQFLITRKSDDVVALACRDGGITRGRSCFRFLLHGRITRDLFSKEANLLSEFRTLLFLIANLSLSRLIANRGIRRLGPASPLAPPPRRWQDARVRDNLLRVTLICVNLCRKLMECCSHLAAPSFCVDVNQSQPRPPPPSPPPPIRHYPSPTPSPPSFTLLQTEGQI